MLNIGIFYGGFSSEFEISKASASTILENFPTSYNAFLVEIRKENWTAKYNDKSFAFDPWNLSFICDGKTIHIDYALIYIHGNPGENGKIQAFLDLKGIPYLNSGALASELSFDKWYCNQFLRNFGINVANSRLLLKGEKIDENEIITELALPCFVKPSDSGSSYGISKVKSKQELLPAIEKAFQEGESLVIESFLDGIEVTCGVYRKVDGVFALPLTEIATENDFFDYDAKYLGKSDEITPARISKELTLEVQNIAKRIYKLLNLKSISRIDFMLVNNKPYVIEVNTTPGFSAASIVPKMLVCEGISLKEFWAEIVEVEIGK